MGKREEFAAQSAEFAGALRAMESLGALSRNEWKRRTGKFPNDIPTHGCYRIMTRPKDELEEWEEEKGYKSKKSTWGRFVCTANKYLPWFLQEGLVPPHLQHPQVMIEVEKWGIDCLKYSLASLGAYPYKEPKGICMDATDMYVDTQDLVLSECFSYGDVEISDIKRIFLDPEAKDEVRTQVHIFANRHKIPIKEHFPHPDDHEGGYGGKTLTEEYKDLITYLKGRKRVCPDRLTPPRDVAAAALSEAYDQTMHHWTPVGASDALATQIEVGKKNYALEPVFNRGNPPEGCMIPEIERQRIADELVVEALQEEA